MPSTIISQWPGVCISGCGRGDVFAAACSKFGFACDSELVPSRNAAAARARSPRGPQHLELAHPMHDEFTVATAGALIMLWYCSEGLKAKRLRSRSAGLLAGCHVDCKAQTSNSTFQGCAMCPSMVVASK